MLALLALGACNAILGNEERTPYRDASAAGADAGGSAGTSGTGGTGGTLEDAAADADGPVAIDCDAGVSDDASVALCPGGVMYVSDLTGSDANSGCSPCFPKQTLGGALATLTAATSADAGGATLPAGFAIKICAGEYSETSLVLDRPISLLGGYDCATWQRTSGYGWPSFDKVNETILRNGDVSKQPDSLRVEGGAVDTSVSIDGFTIEGWQSAAPPANSIALSVRAGAQPQVHDNRIVGGASTGTGGGGGQSNIATTGLWIEDSSPNVSANQIEGGSGQTSDHGSVGVLVRGASSTPKIAGNVIRGGSGVGQDDGSVGLRVIGGASLSVAGGNPITKNEIWAGTGHETSLFGTATAGVALDTAADLVDNQIHGEQSPGPTPIVVGVRAGGDSLVAQNRIYAGSATGGAIAAGIWVVSDGVHIENNMIHAGSGDVQTTGVWIQGDDVTILHNTIVSDRDDGVGTTNPVEQIFIDASKKDAVIRGNILMADPKDNAVGIRSKACLEDFAIKTLFANVFLNDAFLANFQVSGCAGTVSLMQLLENPIGSVGGSHGEDLYYKGVGQCSGQPGCLELATCAGTTPSCFLQLFSAWSGNGTSELFADGWKLKTKSVPCPIARGASSKSVPVDLYGTLRTPDLSLGAHEFDGPCL